MRVVLLLKKRENFFDLIFFLGDVNYEKEWKIFF